ncbi:hypothetical protein DMA11_14405 [Marinilabiliaceae bacterium JC017]|nr:hypothetical protein DMA11_14405 [Marinilabiliaceae bacterium JC017]
MTKTEEKKRLISTLLDDLTHLEINTIIKKGMISSPPLNTIEEVVNKLLEDYKVKLGLIINWHGIGEFKDNGELTLTKYHTIKKFHTLLNKFTEYLNKHKIRLDETDYAVILRMKSFCDYAYSKAHEIIVERDHKTVKSEDDEQPETQNIYNVNLETLASLASKSAAHLKMDARDRIKLKRLYDLGTETIVMQTRFGLDGDVITRIEEGFANKPKQLVIDIHDKHTNLSINYWRSLINIITDFASGFFKN